MTWDRTHKVPLALFAIAITLGLLEMRLPDESTGALERPESYLQDKANVVKVSEEIYPGRALTLYYKAYQASLCSHPSNAQSPACKSRDPVAPGEVRKLIERSLATGNRSIEYAMYNYAVVLIQEGAPAEDVDDAVRKWRLSYPTSTLADPRDAARTPK